MSSTPNRGLRLKSILQNAGTAPPCLREPATLFVYIAMNEFWHRPRGSNDRLLDRLNQRPEERVRPSRRAVLAWALTAAAAVPFGFALFSAKRIILPRLEHQSPSGSPDLPAVSGLVAVSRDGHNKVFHIPSCPYLHGKPKFLSLEEAVREGYKPCPICIGKRQPEKKGSFRG